MHLTRRFDPDLALAIETRSRQTVHVHKAVDAEGGEARLYCYSEARAKKEQGIANRFAARFEGEMSTLNDGLKRPRTRKRLDRVWQRIGRIREKSRGAAAHYDIDVIADDSGEKARAVTWERRPLAGTMITHPGVYWARLPGRCEEAGQLAMRLHAAAGRDRPHPGAAIARPGRARRLRPGGPSTGRCGTAPRHAPLRHPGDGRGSGNPRESLWPDRVALGPMERCLQLPTVEPVPEREGPSPGSAI